MEIERSGTRPDSARTAIDRHAVVAVGHLLMSAISLENRVRRLSADLGMFPARRPLRLPAMSSSLAQPAEADSEHGYSVHS
jgi:hypothetical protein